MTSLAAKEISDWYQLFRSLITDVRNFFPKERNSRLELYDELFRVVRFIHVDYISYFQTFVDDLILNSEKSISYAKKKFLAARNKHAYQRTLTKFDTSNYLNLTEDVSELRFLTSILWYFHYSSDPSHILASPIHLDLNMWMAKEDKRGGDRAWNSASLYFWEKVKDCKNKDEAKEMAESLMNSINSRFLTIMQNYTDLESSWRFGSRPMETIVTKDLMKINIPKEV